MRLLDPAAGTLTFVIRAIEEALSESKDSGFKGLIPPYIEKHIIPHFYAFELLIVPYIIGHLRAALYLKERRNYRLRGNEKVQFYLTNSLEMKEPEQVPLLLSLPKKVEK